LLCGKESTMIILRINMHVLPKNQKEVSQTLLSMIEPMGKEKGCLCCDVFCDMEDENILSLIEEWETREDLDRYIATKRFRVLLGAESLLNEPLEIQIHTVSRSEGIEAVNAARGKTTSFFPKRVERRNRI
jgi:quinol monooxygenase YgiN